MKQYLTYKDNIEVKYSTDEDYFCIDSPLSIDKHFSDTLDDIEHIKKYSIQNDDIVDIHDVKIYKDSDNMDRVLIKTEYLDDYFPMISMKSNHGLYNENEKSKMNNYFFSMSNRRIDELQQIYDKIVDSYQRFLDVTNYYFFDISSNNVMVKHSESFQYKLIDILSIKKPMFRELEINPYSILFYHNFVKHKSYKEKAFFNFLMLNGNNEKHVEEYLLKINQIKPKKLINRSKV